MTKKKARKTQKAQQTKLLGANKLPHPRLISEERQIAQATNVATGRIG